MTQLEQLAASEQHFAPYFTDVRVEVQRAIAAASLPLSQVTLMYVDNALPGEGWHEWLDSHFRPDFTGFTVESDTPYIPDTAAEVILRFANTPPAHGSVDDNYLQALASHPASVNSRDNFPS